MNGDIGVAERLGREAKQILILIARKMQLREVMMYFFSFTRVVVTLPDLVIQTFEFYQAKLHLLSEREAEAERKERDLIRKIRLLKGKEMMCKRKSASDREQLVLKSRQFQVHINAPPIVLLFLPRLSVGSGASAIGMYSSVREVKTIQISIFPAGFRTVSHFVLAQGYVGMLCSRCMYLLTAGDDMGRRRAAPHQGAEDGDGTARDARAAVARRGGAPPGGTAGLRPGRRRLRGVARRQGDAIAEVSLRVADWSPAGRRGGNRLSELRV